MCDDVSNLFFYCFRFYVYWSLGLVFIIVGGVILDYFCVGGYSGNCYFGDNIFFVLLEFLL